MGITLLTILSFAYVPAIFALKAESAVKLGLVRVENGRLVTDEGQVFVFGINDRGFSRPPAEGWDDFWRFADQDATNLKSHGFNTVRLVPYWALIETSQTPSDFLYDYAYVDKIVQTIRVFSSHGMYTILNIHTYETSQGSAPLAKFLPMANNVFGDGFFTDSTPTSGREHLKQVWLMLSARLRNETAVLAYDLLNEPHHSGPLSNQQVSDGWFATANYVTSALRAAGDNHVVMVEMAPWASYCGYMTSGISDTNTVYSPHFYAGVNLSSPPSVVHAEGSWLNGTFNDKGADATFIGNKMKQFASLPFVIGEFGGFIQLQPSSTTEKTYIRNVVDVFTKNRVAGFTYWCYMTGRYGNPLIDLDSLSNSLAFPPLRRA
jgi:aryl-phospho-beta-D-glucosidase BglC (GH1 family)